jgi:uncharacterized protein
MLLSGILRCKMNLNLRKLMTGEVAELSFAGELDLSELELNGQRPLKAPVKIKATAEDRAGVILLEVSISLNLETDCARCADPVAVEKTLIISHTLSEEVQDDENDEILKITDGSIDLYEHVREAVILESDMRYLCSEACKGICPKCGKNLNQGNCGCPPEIDPRWEALVKLLD